MFSRSKTKSDNASEASVVPLPAAHSVAPVSGWGSKAVKAIPVTEKPSIISEGLVMRGDLDSSGVLYVEGGVIGNVKVDSANVSAGGFIEGHLVCSSLTVKGRFDGVLICDELIIAASAQVKGQVSYRFITISSGAQVEAEVEWRGVGDV
jgi:cytoskeletal protein CcmA (bactofilin family)